MGFKDKPFQERWKQMGDQAEKAYLRTYNGAHHKHDKFGWDRTDLDTSRMSPKLRYMPDFMTVSTGGAAWLTECVGFGKDQLLKFKVEKLEALQEWDKDCRTFVFIYDSSRDYHAMTRVDALQYRAAGCPIKRFPEGKEYYEIPADRFNMQPVGS